MRASLTIAVAGVLGACASDGPDGPGGGAVTPSDGPIVAVEFADVVAGELVGLRAGGGSSTVEWVERSTGRIVSADLEPLLDTTAEPADDAVEPSVVATIPDLALDGQQWGALGTTTIDDRRFASWTRLDPDDGTGHLVVGELVDGSEPRIVWDAGPAGSGGIGGPIAVHDGWLLVSLGQNVTWIDDDSLRGALVRIDPDGDADQTPEILSTGYVNPWAFTVDQVERDESGRSTPSPVWVADNAAGPDRDDPDTDDVERFGRADLLDRADLPRSGAAERAPTSMAILPDGRIGICGFLDGELRAHEVVPAEAIDDPTLLPDAVTPDTPVLDRAGTIMPCSLGVTVLDDGTIVTLAATDTVQALLALPPA